MNNVLPVNIPTLPSEADLSDGGGASFGPPSWNFLMKLLKLCAKGIIAPIFSV
jgi:hypothetical protein